MFADCIRDVIHPSTWAVIGYKHTDHGEAFAHRGTAFAITDAGHLTTCWHVTFADHESAEDHVRMEVVQPELDLTRHEVELIGREKDRDVAVLKIKDETVETRPVTLAVDRAAYGTSCGAFGHPLATTGADSIRIFTRAGAGVVSMSYVTPRFAGCRPIRLYELDFFTHSGSSGGPVFLSDGRVFGMVSGSLLLGDGADKTRSNLSVAIDIAEVVEFLKGLGIDL